MKIKILQKGGNKDGHEIIKEAIEFYAKKLMSTRMANTLTIRVAMRVTGRNGGEHGHVIQKCNGSKAQKTFNINIDRDSSLVDQLSTLAHEMVHVEQIAMKRLQYRYWKSDHQLHTRWNGEEVGKVNLIPYLNQPWEVEARYLQIGLKNMFFKEVMDKKTPPFMQEMIDKKEQ